MLQTHTDFDQAENERLQRAMEEIERLRNAFLMIKEIIGYEEDGQMLDRIYDTVDKALRGS